MSVVSLETTFLVDLLNGVPEAIVRAKGLEDAGEPRCVTPPAMAEVLVGAHFLGERGRSKAQDLLGTLTLLEFDRESCEEAGRMGADLLAQGRALGSADLFIAAITKRHGQRLLTRDRAFAGVRGLSLETY